MSGVKLMGGRESDLTIPECGLAIMHHSTKFSCDLCRVVSTCSCTVVGANRGTAGCVLMCTEYFCTENTIVDTTAILVSGNEMLHMPLWLTSRVVPSTLYYHCLGRSRSTQAHTGTQRTSARTSPSQAPVGTGERVANSRP